jgi:hypothetical protein
VKSHTRPGGRSASGAIGIGTFKTSLLEDDCAPVSCNTPKHQ